MTIVLKTKADMVKALRRMLKINAGLEAEMAELRNQSETNRAAAETQDHERRAGEVRHSEEMALVLKRLDEILAIVRKP